MVAGIKARDIAYIRLRSPDLTRQQAFLTEFGMLPVELTDRTLYMRGTDPARYIHVTEQGDPKFLGLGWYASSEEDLDIIARTPGASPVHDIDAPGGGKRVCLTDPNGYAVEIVYGIAPAEPIVCGERPMNDARRPLNRAGTLMRMTAGPAAVKRIAHGVIFTPKFAETLKWYRDTLGLIGSDDLYAGSPDNLIASFNRCDAGEEFVDHHAFFTMVNDRCGLNHVSFEVQNIDDLFLGHHHLKKLNEYAHVWGIGRHLPGSQIFDYWEDPWGRVHEHWTDSDRLNVANGTNVMPVEEGLVSQWGEEPPKRFIGYVSP